MEEKEKINDNNEYPYYRQIFIFIFFYVISIFLSIFYLSYFVNKKVTSKLLFISCFLYFSFFIFLQFIVNFDIGLHYKGILKNMNLLFKLMNYFYTSFSIFSYFLRFIIFPFSIGYLKSGYITKWKRCLDAIFHHKIIIIIASIVIFFCIILIFIFKAQLLNIYDRMGLTLINCLHYRGLVEIYLNVGFFLVQLFIDCKRKTKKKLIIRYNNFLIKKLRKKEKRALEKIHKSYDKLNDEEIKNYLKNININYNDNIQSLLEQVKSSNEIYLFDFNNVNTNNDKNNEEDKNEIGNYEVKLDENQLINCKKNINEIENELAPYIRTFKSKIRKIVEFEYIIEDIKKTTIKDLNKTCCYRFFLFFKFFIFFLVLFEIVIIEFIFPFSMLSSKQGDMQITYSNEVESFGVFMLGIFLYTFISILNSSYTIAVLYSINKRKFISGNFFYGKQRGDDLNLMETIKTLAGIAFPLSYVNIYILYWICLKSDIYLESVFHQIFIIPDYLILGKYNLFILIKLSLIIFFGVISHCFEIKMILEDLIEFCALQKQIMII